MYAPVLGRVGGGGGVGELLGLEQKKKWKKKKKKKKKQSGWLCLYTSSGSKEKIAELLHKLEREREREREEMVLEENLDGFLVKSKGTNFGN